VISARSSSHVDSPDDGHYDALYPVKNPLTALFKYLRPPLGEYSGSNVKVAPLLEIIRFSGDLGKQIKELPDGAQIELRVVP